MTGHIHSFFSICSIGKFYCCESCLFRNGKECPNQAYGSKWKAINLYTGKALLEDNFQNAHWDPNASSESNAKSNSESNTQSYNPEVMQEANSSEFFVDELPSSQE